MYLLYCVTQDCTFLWPPPNPAPPLHSIGIQNIHVYTHTHTRMHKNTRTHNSVQNLSELAEQVCQTVNCDNPLLDPHRAHTQTMYSEHSEHLAHGTKKKKKNTYENTQTDTHKTFQQA